MFIIIFMFLHFNISYELATNVPNMLKNPTFCSFAPFSIVSLTRFINLVRETI